MLFETKYFNVTKKSDWLRKNVSQEEYEEKERFERVVGFYL